MKKIIFVLVSAAFLNFVAVCSSVQASSGKVACSAGYVVPSDTCKKQCKNAGCCKAKGVKCQKSRTKNCAKTKK